MTRTGGRRRIGEEFTAIRASWVPLLVEARLSGHEWAVLVALAQHPCANGTLSRPVADYMQGDRSGIASATGLREDEARRALTGLTKKSFIDEDGERVPVLERVGTTAHAGRAAVFKTNLPGVKPEKRGKSVTQKRGKSATSSVANPPPHLEESKGADKKKRPFYDSSSFRFPDWL